MAGPKLKLDRRGLRQLAGSEAFRQACREVAQDGMSIAVSLSPEESGEYAASFDVEDTEVEIDGVLRKGARIINNAPHAAAVEFGNQKARIPHRVLGQTKDRMES